MHFYSLQGAAGPFPAVAGHLGARGWVFWTRVAGLFGERVAGKALIYSQMSTSLPPPEPG